MVGLKKLGKGLVCLMFLSGGCMGSSSSSSSSTPIFDSEDLSVKFGSDISSGTISLANDIKKPFDKISNLSNLDVKQKSELMKNIYLAYYYAGEAMVSFRSVCLTKMLEIAASCPKADTESVDYKLSELLCFSQISDDRKTLSSLARAEIVENVINRLSKAVNGDKAPAQNLLKSFYSSLQGTEFSDYVPYN
jgi:hypothetical protein